MVEGEVPEPDLSVTRVGTRLREAREAAGLDLNDIGTRTRIPVRHLAAIEAGDYRALPSPTYSLGFAKAYARALGIEEAPLMRDLREELGREDPLVRETMPYEPADPSRVPSRLLAWTAAILAVVIAAGYLVWRSHWYAPTQASVAAVATSPAVAPPVQRPAVVAPTPPQATGPGQVTLVATAPVWLRIRTADGQRLLEKEMAVGERYDVPLTAADPRILTGKPDGLRVLVDGRDVAPLGAPATTVKNVSLTAQALAARPAASGPVVSPPPATGTAAPPATNP